MKKIAEICRALGIKEEETIPFGFYKTKIDLSILNRLKNKQNGKLILVTAITPTPAGEGKTTVAIGLGQGLKEIGKNPIIALREPSLGPVFGLKGGATGGGMSSVYPQDEINLHFTGDFHAITAANNLLSALIDNHIFQGNELKIKTVTWKRTIDMNDRSLRNIETKIRKDNFVITAASEIMAILALASSLEDLKKRINQILIGYNDLNQPLYVRDLGAADSMVLLLKEALNPNLVQTIDGVPTLIHAGPFANIAHGCNSIVATKLALKLADYTITEAGFGSDLGMQKFLDLKVPYLDKSPELVVLVATIRALKSHGLSDDYNKEDLKALEKGLKMLEKHIDIIKSYNLNYIIALNDFYQDTKAEQTLVMNFAKSKKHPISLAKGYEMGGKGMIDLANQVDQLSNNPTKITNIYNSEDKPKIMIEKIATKIYGANQVTFSPQALNQLEMYEKLGWNLPVCIAKTPLSLTGDSKQIGFVKDFELKIEEIRPSLGAGFLVALTKGINIMPGLNKTPRALDIKLDEVGNLIE